MYCVCLEYVFKCKVVSDEEGKSLQFLSHRDTRYRRERSEQDGKTALWRTAERRTCILEWQRTEVTGGDSSKTVTPYRNRIIMLKKKLQNIVYRKGQITESSKSQELSYI